MGLPPDNENVLRRFLLGTLSAAEREAIEDRFMVESDLFDALHASEEELLEEYASDELSVSERQQIERSLLLVPGNRERVRLLSAIRAAVDRGQARAQPSLAQQRKDRSFFRLPALRYALAVACLFLMFGIVWWLLPGREREESLQANNLQANNTPSSHTAQLPPTPETARTVNEQPATKGSDPSVNSNAVPQTSLPNDKRVATKRRADAPLFVASLLLTPGATRSEGAVSELILPAKAQWAQIKLVLETNDYTRYRAVLSDEDGAPVWTSGAHKVRGQIITLNIPRRFLREGDYLINLSGLTAGASTGVANYSFRISTP